MRKWRQIYNVKTSPQTTGSIEADLQSVHIHSDQKIDPKVYNLERFSKLFTMPTHIHNLQAIKSFYGFLSEYCYILC